MPENAAFAASPTPSADSNRRLGWTVAAIAVCGYASFRFLAIEWAVNPQYGYGWGIPVLAMYLFLKRWPTRPDPQPFRKPSFLAAAAILLALPYLPLTVLLEANPDWRLLLWAASCSYVAALFMALAYASGRPWVRHFAAPLLFLLLATPWPSFLEQPLVQGLTHQISVATVECMRWFGYPAVVRGNIIQLANGDVGVNEACSGIRSFQTTFMLAIFFGELYRLAWVKRLILVAGGLAWSVLVNFSRTSFLTWLTASEGPEAQNRYHDPAGLIGLGVGLAGVYASATFLTRKASASAPAPAAVTRLPRLLPIKAVVITIAWLAAAEVAKEAWFRSRQPQLVATVDWTVQWPAATEGFKEEPLGEDVKAVLRSDSEESGVWKRADGSEWTMFFIQWEPGRMSAPLARGHTPEICLPATGFKQVGRSGNLVLNAGDLEIPFSSYTFLGSGHRWHVFFCIAEDGVARDPNMDLSEENYLRELAPKRRLLAAWQGKRHYGQQVFEIAMRGYASEDEARRALQSALPSLIKRKG
ncbi:MAG TPA: exosortase/archaeosortase family protein [Methylomirabilota bacterium]|nr:exosortase/archaeosortase family protein [Methylomirabilota bacterium]